MTVDEYTFGRIVIDGKRYDNDVIIEKGVIRPRNKKPSKKWKGEFGHTPLSPAEDIPWSAGHLVVGTGAEGMLPIMEEVKEEAKRRGVTLASMPTEEAISCINDPDTNLILHLTC
ncbi:MAG: MTH938/NDUFAF3 family protein [Spirochaetaceae bacterium]